MGGGKAPLAFLGKKSWHTKNLKNVERVWIAEEREKAEQRKLEELRKQIEEEREMVELRTLQEGAGMPKGPEKVRIRVWVCGCVSVACGVCVRTCALPAADFKRLSLTYSPFPPGGLDV